MIKRVGGIFKNNKGGQELIMFFIIFPILFVLFLNIMLYGAYQIRQIEMTAIVNMYHDKACSEGQITLTEKANLLDELNNKGFKTENIRIIAEPSSVYDNNDSTYVPRYADVVFGIVYENPHAYYYISKFFLPGAEGSDFWIGDKYTGMSEKW